MTAKRRIPHTGKSGITTIVRHRDNGPLHSLLLRACPADEHGVKSITVLAKKLDLTPWSIHKWIKKGSIPPGRAAQIVDLNPEEVTLADFSVFVYV